MFSSNFDFTFNISFLSQISTAPNITVATILSIKVALCHDEVKLKLGLWMSGIKRALIITIGTSRNAMIAKTAQTLALLCIEPGRLDLKIR